MLSVTNMIIRIRSSTHDQQETGYSDDDLLAYINDGVRFVRRTVMSIAPTMLADIDLSGELAAGESKVTSISIHAPTRGATLRSDVIAAACSYFNPRTHAGCDEAY